MRIVAHNNLIAFWSRHPEAAFGLRNWEQLVRRGSWRSMHELTIGIGGSKALNGERARFAVAGGNYRLIAAFNFKRQIAYVKFIGTHAEYDRIDALTVEQF